MSEHSPFRDLGAPRFLRGPELELVKKLLLEAGDAATIERLSTQLVQEMSDRGMGSLYFVRDKTKGKHRRMSRCIAQIQFKDTDGVDVLASLDVDQYSDLFELDVWKVDFAPTDSLVGP